MSQLWPSTIRARLTLWYSALLGLPLLIFAVVCFQLFARALQARTDLFIADALHAVAREVVAERRAAAGVEDAIRTTLEEVRFQELHVVVRDSSGRLVAIATEPGAAPSPLDTIQFPGHPGDTGTFATRSVTAVEGSYRLIARPLVIDNRRFVLTGRYSLAENEAALAQVRGIFVIAIPLLLAVAATSGWFLAKRSLAPVSSMAGRAAEIGSRTLHERLPVGGGAELVHLSSVFNNLLDRLEASFEQQRRFMADASHELRTPTAIVRAEADVTLSRNDRSPADYRASLQIVQDAARRLTRIVDDLFLLGRTDSGHLVPRPGQLWLEELLHDSTHGVRQLAETRGVTVSLGVVIEAPFEGDADLLGRLFLNLLDNAIKYSPSPGKVTVDLSRVGEHYIVRVADQGPGIPSAARERIFERFYRLDESRSRTEESGMSGAGLGLPIARRIAELHGGSLALGESRPGTTEFIVSLPVISPLSRASSPR
ncbi:MAG: sensor histidine kinase [Gemmatimonadota bacterium]